MHFKRKENIMNRRQLLKSSAGLGALTVIGTTGLLTACAKSTKGIDNIGIQLYTALGGLK